MWSRAVVTRYGIFFYELIPYHFFNLCMKWHRVKCCFSMHTGWCLTVNANIRTANSTSALATSDPMMTASWKSSKRSMYLRCLDFVIGGWRFEWGFESLCLFFLFCFFFFFSAVTRRTLPPMKMIHALNTCIRIARSWVGYRCFSFLLLNLLDACQGSHYRMLKSL